MLLPQCKGVALPLVTHCDTRCRTPLCCCRASVAELCAREDAENSEMGLVYKCLASHYTDLDVGCQKELGRAVHMAFFVWQEDAILTSDCDDDVRQLCLSERPNMAHTPGAVGQCLAQKVRSAPAPCPPARTRSLSSVSWPCGCNAVPFPAYPRLADAGEVQVVAVTVPSAGNAE